MGWAPLVILATLGAAALAAPVLAALPPTEMSAGSELRAPSLEHPFGTDEFGRDIWSRTLFGLRTSFVVGTLSALLGGTIGVTIGTLAGYRGGRTDGLLMRLIDGLLAIPAILLGIAIVAALGPGLRNVMLTLAVVQIPVYARLARGAVLSERHTDHVTAAISLGCDVPRILRSHVLPNVLSTIVVQTALAVGFAVLIEASLSFLGLGIRPPEPSLGSILDGSRSVMRHAPWYPLFPGVTLVLLLYALNGTADLLNDLLDPRRR